MENGLQWLFINNNNNKVNNILHCSYITKICVWNKIQFNFSLGMEIKWTKPPLQYKYISASGIVNQIKIETTTTKLLYYFQFIHCTCNSVSQGREETFKKKKRKSL